MNRRVRIAAVGDVHLGPDLRGQYAPHLRRLSEEADILLVAGDLTQHGTCEEAEIFAEEFRQADVPVVAVLGNHDYHSDSAEEIQDLIAGNGITVLNGDHTAVTTSRGTVGVAGVKGFCLGFSGRCAANFGEPEMREFTSHGLSAAESLRTALDATIGDVRVVLTHFAPIEDTLIGEPPEIWAFLGNYLLGDAIDAGAADFAVHGHAHAGRERGTTLDGVPVRNVAQPVIRSAYRVYEVAPREGTRQ